MPLLRPQQPTIRLLRICLFVLIWYNKKNALQVYLLEYFYNSYC